MKNKIRGYALKLEVNTIGFAVATDYSSKQLKTEILSKIFRRLL